MNSLHVHIWNCLNWKVQQFKSLKVFSKKKLDLLDQHRRPTSHIHSLFKIGSISHFSSKTQNCKFETTFFWAPSSCELGDEKKEKKKLVLSKPCRCPRLFSKASNNGSQGCENPFSTELVRFPILLQTLAENRVSAFLYLLLLLALEFWIGELYIGSQKCNNITMPIE